MTPAWAPALVWLLAAGSTLALLVGVRVIRLRRPPRWRDFVWTAMVVLAFAVGGLFAFAYDIASSRRIDLPPAFGEPPNFQPARPAD